MVADIGFFFAFLLEIVAVLIAFVTIGYGLFSLSVKKFDPGVRITCFVVGFICLSAFAFLEYQRRINEEVVTRSNKPELAP